MNNCNEIDLLNWDRSGDCAKVRESERPDGALTNVLGFSELAESAGMGERSGTSIASLVERTSEQGTPERPAGLTRSSTGRNDIPRWGRTGARAPRRYMMRSLNTTRGWLVGGLLILILVLVGCSRDDSPIAPSGPAALEPDTRTELNFLPIVDPGGEGPARGPWIPILIWDRFKDDGGELDNGLIRLVIPENALGDEAYIWIFRDPFYAKATFGPEGLRFAKKVELRFDLDYVQLGSLSPDDVSIWWFDDDLNEWERLDTWFDQSEREVVAEIRHFSVYALSD